MIITWRLGPYEVRSERHLEPPWRCEHYIYRNGIRLGSQSCVPTLYEAMMHEEAHAMAKKQSVVHK